MNLIIAEKPSVALAIARVLGARKKNEGFYEGNQLLVSWCIGHLVSFAEADDYDPRYRKWQYTDLPILPAHWKLNVSKKKQKQFQVLKNLLQRGDVREVCCATDAGREGELIFRLFYEKAGGTLPVTRLWISSMEDKAIQEGYAKRKPSAEYDDLYRAALSRAKADWLVGINASRLFSVHYRETLPVGRVQSPTLALLVERNTAIERFVRTPYFLVRLIFDGFEAISKRFDTREEAEALFVAVLGKKVLVQEIKTEEKTIQPPLLYDLTTLQRDANRLFDFSASETLKLAQQLYEKKLLTYPRTDSRFLTTDMQKKTSELVDLTSQVLRLSLSFEPTIERLLRNDKVSDHHALIPTVNISTGCIQTLPPNEQALLELVALRLLKSVGIPHRYQLTTVTFLAGDQLFTSKGKEVLEEGWKALGKKEETSEKDAEIEVAGLLPPLQKEQSLLVQEAKVTSHKTSPPKPYTEDTLLAAMERAGIEDLADDIEAERQGLGTPATRAGIIDKLITTGLVERKKKTLLPTSKGTNLVAVLPDSLTSASLTAQWENRLNRIASGKESADAFLSDIERSVKILIDEHPSIEASEQERFTTTRKAVGHCPRCASPVYESKKNFYCSNRSCAFVMWKNDLFFTKKKLTLSRKLATSLLAGETIWVKNLYSAKKDQTYEAGISLQDTGKKHVRYKLHFAEKTKTKQEESNGH